MQEAVETRLPPGEQCRTFNNSVTRLKIRKFMLNPLVNTIDLLVMISHVYPTMIMSVIREQWIITNFSKLGHKIGI